jgi:hypothetical protein
VAPQATELLPVILDLCGYIEAGSLAACARHLDWAAKLMCLLNLCQDGAALGDPTTRLADHDFTNTDPQRGAFWRLWEQGFVDPLVSRNDVQSALADGPPEGRGWGQGRIIQHYFDEIAEVNWSYIELRRRQGRWSPRLRIELPRLDSLNRFQFERLIESRPGLEDLESLLQVDDDESTVEADPVLDIRPQLATHGGDDRPRRYERNW